MRHSESQVVHGVLQGCARHVEPSQRSRVGRDVGHGGFACRPLVFPAATDGPISAGFIGDQCAESKFRSRIAATPGSRTSQHFCGNGRPIDSAHDPFIGLELLVRNTSTRRPCRWGVVGVMGGVGGRRGAETRESEQKRGARLAHVSRTVRFVRGYQRGNRRQIRFVRGHQRGNRRQIRFVRGHQRGNGTQIRFVRARLADTARTNPMPMARFGDGRPPIGFRRARPDTLTLSASRRPRRSGFCHLSRQGPRPDASTSLGILIQARQPRVVPARNCGWACNRHGAVGIA